ncbi:hypothetical protein LP417_06945 [Polaromonas sp. P1-6]|nr:hypothetical protein LP417_06945 [Polaromonas sp. P1-6]
MFAAAGALAVELLKLAEVRNIPKHERPDLKEFLYWVPFLILPLIGAGLAYVYIVSEIVLKPILAVNIGISAPLIIRTMASSVPKTTGPIDPGTGA